MKLREFGICMSGIMVLVGLMGCKADASTNTINTPTTRTVNTYLTFLEFITPGSDGNLWFTDAHRNTIAKISPKSGKITEYNTPTSNSDPIYIAKGPDGNLWFAESNNSPSPPVKKIGKISPATGAVTEYSVSL
jgi:streptogramin lyase